MHKKELENISRKKQNWDVTLHMFFFFISPFVSKWTAVATKVIVYILAIRFILSGNQFEVTMWGRVYAARMQLSSTGKCQN
jgi:hypothetical protein